MTDQNAIDHVARALNDDNAVIAPEWEQLTVDSQQKYRKQAQAAIEAYEAYRSQQS